MGAPDVKVEERTRGDRCAFCHDTLRGGSIVACGACGSQCHDECRAQLGHCPTLGCEHGARPRASTPPEVFASRITDQQRARFLIQAIGRAALIQLVLFAPAALPFAVMSRPGDARFVAAGFAAVAILLFRRWVTRSLRATIGLGRVLREPGVTRIFRVENVATDDEPRRFQLRARILDPLARQEPIGLDVADPFSPLWTIRQQETPVLVRGIDRDAVVLERADGRLALLFKERARS